MEKVVYMVSEYSTNNNFESYNDFDFESKVYTKFDDAVAKAQELVKGHINILGEELDDERFEQSTTLDYKKRLFCWGLHDKNDQFVHYIDVNELHVQD